MSKIQELIESAVFWRQHAADAAITGTLEVAASTRVTADDAERRLVDHLWDHGRFRDTGTALAKARRLIAQHTRTPAVLLRAGYPVARCETAARGGSVVECCLDCTTVGNHVSCCTAKVSRARRWLEDDELLERLPLAVACQRGTGRRV